jgi:hypothetical protein
MYTTAVSQGIPHQTYTHTAPTSRRHTILTQFELIPFIYNLRFIQTLMYPPRG